VSFKDKNFRQRYNDPMWHHSEDKFETWANREGWLWDRFGLDQDQARTSTWAYSLFIRHTPDYVCQLHPRGTPFLVEVQGTGTKNPSHKFKLDKIEQLKKWNSHQDVWLWLWNDRAKRNTIISLNKLQLLIAQGKATRGAFDDGKRPYWELPVAVVETATDWRERKERYN
jgi:hypothetical protein